VNKPDKSKNAVDATNRLSSKKKKPVADDILDATIDHAHRQTEQVPMILGAIIDHAHLRTEQVLMMKHTPQTCKQSYTQEEELSRALAASLMVDEALYENPQVARRRLDAQAASERALAESLAAQNGPQDFEAANEALIRRIMEEDANGS
jgi:hypothetical protein